MTRIKTIGTIALTVALSSGGPVCAQAGDPQVEQSAQAQRDKAFDDAAAAAGEAVKAGDALREAYLTPQGLSDALSCRSYDAAMAFAYKLFLESKPIGWMDKIEDIAKDKATRGMMGLYGYRPARPVSLLGEPVGNVYFMKDWVVTLMPRARAEAFIKAHELKRAPIKFTEQYYRFVDPEAGPMIGAFVPTGDATAAMLAMALGAKLPPSPPSDMVFVGCNYTPASETDFLKAAGQSDDMVKGAAEDVGDAMDAKPKR